MKSINPKIESYVRRIKSLSQFKNRSLTELYQYASKKLNEPIYLDEDIEDVSFSFVNQAEKNKFEELYRKYANELKPENISERNTLRILAYLEILNFRIAEILTDYVRKKNVPPPSLNRQYNENLSKILEIKDRLGLGRQEEKSDAFKYLEQLRIRFDKYIREHRHEEFTTRCPSCGLTYLIRRRTVTKCPHCNQNIGMEQIEHPFLWKGKTLYNPALLELVDKKKITVEEASKVLNTSPDYIRYIYERIYLRGKNDSPVE